MKIEHIEIYGFRSAFRGLRNPMDSWDKSDTTYNIGGTWSNSDVICIECPDIGQQDLALACKLIKGGSEHRKFLRQIQIWMDITIPRYVWTELDTYKVATVRNSCSTMHKLGTRDLTQDDFELDIPETLLSLLNQYGTEFRTARVIKDTIRMGIIRHEYKNILPEGFLQKATFTMNYETALAMYFQRRNHRLPEWRADKEGSICSFLTSLPYMKEFIEAREG